MQMIGISVRSTATRFCSSRPLRSGRETSSIRQFGTRAGERVRNSCADANVSGFQPWHRISNSSDSRTATSSSTTNTIGVTSDLGEGPNSHPNMCAKLMVDTPEISAFAKVAIALLLYELRDVFRVFL